MHAIHIYLYACMYACMARIFVFYDVCMYIYGQIHDALVAAEGVDDTITLRRGRHVVDADATHRDTAPEQGGLVHY